MIALFLCFKCIILFHIFRVLQPQLSSLLTMMLSSYTAPFGRSDYVRIYPDYPTLKETRSTVDHGDTRSSTMILVVVLGAVICSLFVVRAVLSQRQHPNLFNVSDQAEMQPCTQMNNQHIPKIIHSLTPQHSGIRVINNQSSVTAPGSSVKSRAKCDVMYRVAGYIRMSWTLRQIERLVEDIYPGYLDTWRSYSSDVTRGHAAKYFILHHYGGLFIEVPSSRCYNKALQLLNDKSFRQDTLLFSRDNRIDSGIFASKPCSDFIEFSIRLLNQQHREVLPPYGEFVLKPNRDFLMYSIGKFRGKSSVL